MRLAVVNETSAVDKHPTIMSALEGRGLDVVNAGMAAKGEVPELQYIQTGLISALLLAATGSTWSSVAAAPGRAI